MSDATVLPFVRPPETRLVCERCTRFIEKGEAYHEVRAPNGAMLPVHATCMGDKAPA